VLDTGICKIAKIKENSDKKKKKTVNSVTRVRHEPIHEEKQKRPYIGTADKLLIVWRPHGIHQWIHSLTSILRLLLLSRGTCHPLAPTPIPNPGTLSIPLSIPINKG